MQYLNVQYLCALKYVDGNPALALQTSVFSLCSLVSSVYAAFTELLKRYTGYHLAYSQFCQLLLSLPFFLSQKVSSSCLLCQIVVAVYVYKKQKNNNIEMSQLKLHYIFYKI